VVLGEPVQVILDRARGADSIVMATMGRTGLGRLLIGSVAERVVRHSPVPVLSLRSGRSKR
jgi:nucleotide-binding universal stress UspA family protein